MSQAVDKNLFCNISCHLDYNWGHIDKQLGYGAMWYCVLLINTKFSKGSVELF